MAPPVSGVVGRDDDATASLPHRYDPVTEPPVGPAGATTAIEGAGTTLHSQRGSGGRLPPSSPWMETTKTLNRKH